MFCFLKNPKNLALFKSKLWVSVSLVKYLSLFPFAKFRFLILILFLVLFTVRRCDQFPVPPNGMIKGGTCNLDYQSTCELICKTGYELSTNGQRTCGITQHGLIKWSGTDPHCNSKLEWDRLNWWNMKILLTCSLLITSHKPFCRI